MFKDLFSHRRRQTPRASRTLLDGRSGAPLRREADPMPRIRWYS